MAILFYVEGLSDGFGDYLFGLKAVHQLKKSLAERGYSDDIFLVTHQEGKKIIQDLGSDKEFGVTVLSREDYDALSKEGSFTLDYYIEGPVMTTTRIPLEPHTPILLLSEYSSFGSVYLESDNLKKSFKKYQDVQSIYSGLRIRSDEKGILISEELVNLTEARKHNDLSFRAHYWQELNLPLRSNSSIEDYHQSTELSFQYSYDYPENSCKRFLSIHLWFNQNSSKNQDIVAIGKNKDKKREALSSVLPELIQSGFGKVLFIDLETGKEEMLHDNGEKNARTYRLFFGKRLTHRQMMALNALSGELCGVRGDQSHGEALSAQKLIVYDCASHKEDYAKGVISCLHALSEDENVRELLHLLQYAELNPKNTNFNEKQFLRLKTLLSNPEVMQKYKEACAKIPQQFNLGAAIADVVIQAFLARQNYRNMLSKFHDLRKAYPKIGFKKKMMFLTNEQRFESVNETEKFIAQLNLELQQHQITYKMAFSSLSEHVEQQIKHILTDHEGNSEHKGRRLLEKNVSRLAELYKKMLPEEKEDFSMERPFSKSMS
ncbi:hypothetical protein E3983_03580 [Legionella israelensis]|uniref:Dot/Icm T4SS effector n=1 Tax=Legionella israelensis TaxID=454 RepID=A0AAX1EEK7_9GAMM|nr:hypothetical protein [Legionella israelensis]QBR83518.1 hypothetical protein E3983_03580 [Legionella israelensis]